jgi:hypothetical protein
VTPRFVISGFLRDVNEICALLGYYAAVKMYLSVPSSTVKKFKKMGPIGCPETSLHN